MHFTTFDEDKGKTVVFANPLPQAKILYSVFGFPFAGGVRTTGAFSAALLTLKCFFDRLLDRNFTVFDGLNNLYSSGRR